MTALGTEARLFLRGARHGVLSTISQRMAGYPFGSITPFVPDPQGRPVILISTLAEHTRNIAADPRVSLLVHDARAEDVQAHARLTLVGNAAPLDDPGRMRARFIRYLPQAADLLALADFSFYRIEPLQLRYIGGFGKIHWVGAEAYAPPDNSLAESEDEVVEHMNAEHARNLRDYCRHYKGVSAADATMAGIDCDGFDVRVGGALLRFDFESPVRDANQARGALIALAKASKA